MSLPSLAEQFRQQCPDVDRLCLEQEAQERLKIQDAVDTWAAHHESDNDPHLHDTETALAIAESQGVSWSRVVLDALRLDVAAKKMTQEVRRLEAKFCPPKIQCGVADYNRLTRAVVKGLDYSKKSKQGLPYESQN